MLRRFGRELPQRFLNQTSFFHWHTDIKKVDMEMKNSKIIISNVKAYSDAHGRILRWNKTMSKLRTLFVDFWSVCGNFLHDIFVRSQQSQR